MWPWEHLAFGYLFVSGFHRLAGRRVGVADLVAVAAGTQLPDLIDKPLSWGLGLLPSGLSLGHSLLFAVPVWLAAVLVARRKGRTALGVGFAVAYASHLLGDALYPFLTGGQIATGFLWWPLVPASPEAGAGLLVQLSYFVGVFVAFLGTPTGQVYLLFELLLIAGTGVLWYLDGSPGLAWLRLQAGLRTQ